MWWAGRFCLSPPFVPFSAPLYTSSVLFWGARFGFPLSNILVCLPIKKNIWYESSGLTRGFESSNM